MSVGSNLWFKTKQCALRFHNLDVWWVESILAAILVGVLILSAQWVIDDSRSDREQRAAQRLTESSERLENLRSNRAERLENLRFVRDRSSQKYEARPFAGLDLSEQDMGGLDLRGADLTSANLVGARFRFTLLEMGLEHVDPDDPQTKYLNPIGHETNLVAVKACRADFTGARLAETNMSMGNFSGANFTVASLAGADLRGANLMGSTLDPRSFTSAWAFSLGPTDSRVNRLDGAIYDDSTIWPNGFPPPRKLPVVSSNIYGSAIESSYRASLVRPNC